jgi:hypothetical protein
MSKAFEKIALPIRAWFLTGNRSHLDCRAASKEVEKA